MEGPYADAARDAFGNAEQRQSPLVLDLDGDGLDLIALTNSKAFFDLDNDGFVERVGWVGADDGLLAIDLDANGLIEGRTELFGGSPSDGFASLRLLDSNADNLIDANDAEFANLKVWRDLNGNGVSEGGELQSLTAAGIASISLASVHLTTPQTIAGNSVTDTSTFTWTAGGTGTIADVWFSVNQAFSFDARPVEIVPEALFLPTLRGYGVISSLTAQMSRDPTLLTMVQDFVETPLTDVTDAQIRGIMYRWAGVDGIAPNARTVYGATIDSRKIVFLERFLDDPYTQTTYGSNASPTGVADLEAAFAAVFDAVKVRLLAQAQLSDVLGIGAFDYLSDSFVAGLDMQAVLSRAQATAIEAASNGAGTAATVAWWRAALPTLNAVAVDAGATEYATWLEAAVRASTGETYGVEDLYDNLIFGTSGADSLTAAGGNDTLDGREGNDLLIGGRGNDSLFGGTNYYSQSGNDTLIGGTGNDTMNGAQGDDLYVFARGDGQDRIYDSGGGIDTIAFAADILPSEVTLARTGANADDLLISIAGGDQIIVQGYFGRDYYSNYTYRIEHILFDDGTTWDYSTILAKVSAGGASNDTLYGLDATGSYNGIDTLDGGDGNDVLDGRTADDLLIGGAGNDSLFGGTNYYGESGNDTLVGGTGNDTMNGAQGDDLYVFARGDGQDRIYDSGGGIDTIAFAADILPSEVTLSRTGPNADDLLISIAGGDQITVQGYFGRDYYSNHTYRIEQIAFADGTSWDYATILAKVSTGGTGNDTIYGLDATGSYNGIDTLDGGAGNDTLDGRTADDLLIGGDGNDSLFGGTNYYSQSGNDTLIGGTGNDTMNGAQGDDLYVFARGDGQDRIYDSGGGIDTIAFAADILPSEVTLARTGTNADDLLISIAGGDQILVQGYFGKDYYGNYTYRIEEVRFADGATWDYATILAKVSGGTAGNDTLLGDDFANEIGGAAGNDRLEGRGGNDTLSGGSGADTLYGGNQNDVLQGDDGNDFLDGNDGDDVASGGADADTVYGGNGNDWLAGDEGNDRIEAHSGNDTLTGGTGNDSLYGGSGDDRYIFALGDGQDYIWEDGGADALLFAAGISPADVTAARASAFSNDLVLTFSGSPGDRVTIGEYFNIGNSARRFEEIRFADGTVWDYATVLAKVLTPTAGNDTLWGDIAANSIDGAEGNDRLDGNDGNDTLSGGAGNDTLVGANHSDLLIGGIGDDRLEGGNDHDTLDGGAGSDTTWGGNGHDQIFGGEDNDTLYGEGGDDTLHGGAGNDYAYDNGGNDAYVFNIGDGDDTYFDQYNGADALYLGAGIDPGNATFKNINGNLVITIDGVPDKLTILNQFAWPNDVIETIRFNDGTTWDYSQLMARLLSAATDGNDTILGSFTSDHVVGLGGDDSLGGGSYNNNWWGNDTIAGGDGNDVIWAANGADSLLGGDGNDTITAGDGNDFISGGAGNDSLNGGNHNDTIVGGTGNDYMYDGNGDATYIFNVGDGNDTIFDQYNGNDTILFAAGITPADVTIRYVGSSMVLAYGAGGDKITVLNHVQWSGDRIETIRFDDGTIWDYAAMTALATTGSGANDTLQGDHGANAIYGHGGDDSLVGWDGNDIIHAGDGNDTVYAGNHNDLIYGGSGDNRIWAENGDDTVYVEDGNDFVDVTWGNDYVDLGAGNNTLYGGDGNDTIIAGSGNDSLMAGNHNDLVHAGDGHDRVWGEGGEDTIHADGGDDFVDGQWGNDLIYLGNGNDTGWGGDQNDAIYGEAGNDTLDGGNHDDTLVGGTGNDWMRGSWGNDLFVYSPGDGIDTISEDGGGSDTLLFAAGIDPAQVKLLKAGNDLSIRIDGTPAILIQNQFHGNANYVIEQIRFNDGTVWNYAQMLQSGMIGTEADDTIVGTATADAIMGVGGNDSLVGGSGDDTIGGGSGNDVADGGAGNDLYLFAPGDGADTVFDSGGTDTLSMGAGILASDVSITRVGSTNDVLITIAGGLGTVLVQNQLGGGNAIDQIRFDDGTIWTPTDIAARAFTGTEGNDTIVGTTTAEAISGSGGNDSLVGGIANWSNWGADTIYGGDGDDTIATGNQHDLMFGGDGNDYMTSGVGNDTFWGGLGNDTAHGGDWNDLLFGEEGDDSLMGGFGEDSLVGGGGNDILRGDYGNDTLIGGDGHDVLDGGDNQDSLVGGEGNDSAWGSWSNDTIIMGDGDDFADGGYDNDLIYGDDGNDTLWGGGSNDTIYGGNGDDTIDGGDHSDIMHGGDGNDVMTGNWGVDTFVGGLGADIMSGQGDNDIFRWDGVAEGSDTITDFGNGEKLQFAASAFGFTAGATLTNGLNYITGAAPAATDATPTFLYNTSNYTLYFDADGTGAEEAVNIVKFTNNHMLAASSFEFI